MKEVNSTVIEKPSKCHSILMECDSMKHYEKSENHVVSRIRCMNSLIYLIVMISNFKTLCLNKVVDIVSREKGRSSAI